jgi:hypothetical protein
LQVDRAAHLAGKMLATVGQVNLAQPTVNLPLTVTQALTAIVLTVLVVLAAGLLAQPY